MTSRLSDQPPQRSCRRSLIAAIASAVSALTLGQAAARSAIASESHRRGLPIYFEENRGQTDPHVRFLSRSEGFEIFLTPAGSVIKLSEPAGDARRAASAAALRRPTKTRRSAAVRLAFQGARVDPEIDGLDPLAGRVNYFLGKNPAKWRTSIPTCARVRYRGVWPGVDLVYYGGDGAIEYDVVAAPNADLGRVRFRIEGADAEIDRDGNVAIESAAGTLTLRRPAIYQLGARGERKKIAGRFVMAGSRNTIGIELAHYDRTRAIVIDPQLVYSTYLGGSGGTSIAASSVGDEAKDITIDSSNDVYVTGLAFSIDFPTTVGPANDPGAATDTPVAFVAKLDPSKSGAASLVYSTYLGGSGNPDSRGGEGDEGTGIAVDSLGNAYVTGLTYSDDFPTTPAAFQSNNKHALPSIDTAFVTEIDPSGANLIYSTFIGGSGDKSTQLGDDANRIALKPGCIASCEAYVAGDTASSDFPMQNAFQSKMPEPSGAMAAFMTVLAGDGGSLVYSTFFGGTNGPQFGGDGALAIAVDSTGSAYITGFTDSNNLPVTGNAFQKTNKAFNSSETNAFVAKLNPALSGAASLVYSGYLGGSGAPANPGDIAYGIAVDSSGRAVVTGLVTSSNFPVTPNAYQRANRAASRGGMNAFVSEFSADGSSLVYSTLLGGTGGPSGVLGEAAADVAIGSNEHLYVAGAAGSLDFPTSGGACQTTNRSATKPIKGFNAFVSELNPGAPPRQQLAFSTYFGGTNSEAAEGLAVDASGNIYAAGFAESKDIPTTLASAFQPHKNAGAHSSQANAFMVEIDPTSGCARLALSEHPIKFPKTGIGAAATTRTLTLKNPSKNVLQGSVTPMTPPFSVSPTGTFDLNPGGPMKVTITFTPTSAVTSRQSLMISSDDPAHQSVQIGVTGTGAPGILAAPKSVAFGKVPAGKSKPAVILLKNKGLGVLTGNVNAQGLPPSDFTVVSGLGDFTLTAGRTFSVDLLFTPPSKRPFFGFIIVTVTSQSSQPAMIIPVSGQGK